MIIELPQVGESVTEGTIVQWLKQPGDSVERYDPLVEVLTDKVSMEVPSPVRGRGDGAFGAGRGDGCDGRADCGHRDWRRR